MSSRDEMLAALGRGNCGLVANEAAVRAYFAQSWSALPRMWALGEVFAVPLAHRRQAQRHHPALPVKGSFRMRRWPTRLIVTALVVTSTLIMLTGSGYAQLVLYDDFSGPLIDPEKWSGFSIEGNSAQPAGEFLRTIDDGQLHLTLTSYGGTDSNSSTVTSRQGLALRQLGTIGASGFIVGLKAKVTILQAEMQDCALNPEAAFPARARAMLVGTFFNDGTGVPNSSMGDVVAFVYMYKQGDSGEHGITAGVQRCTSNSCSSLANIAPQPIFTTTWSIGTPLTLKLVWQQVDEKFTFTVTNPASLASESREIVYAGLLEAAGPPTGTDRKQVKVENNPENCVAARKRGTIDALFDKIKVKRIP